MKLHGSRLMYLRDDPDFMTMVKIGRVINALSFCLENIVKNRDQKTACESSSYRRAHFLLGGYVHQGITLIDRIKGRYLGVPEFEPLRVLVVEAEHRKIRKYAKKVRNYTAFHLDEYDETTRRTLAHLKPETYTMMSGDDRSTGYHYFEFADFLDMAFLFDEFSNGREWKETTEDIVHGIMHYAIEFLGACHTFNHMLWDKKVKEHAY